MNFMGLRIDRASDSGGDMGDTRFGGVGGCGLAFFLGGATCFSTIRSARTPLKGSRSRPMRVAVQ
jgi:hypothetical protein